MRKCSVTSVILLTKLRNLNLIMRKQEVRVGTGVEADRAEGAASPQEPTKRTTGDSQAGEEEAAAPRSGCGSTVACDAAEAGAAVDGVLTHVGQTQG